ncbi:MAG: PHP domain-containing protein [Thermomicrobiales bacterium]
MRLDRSRAVAGELIAAMRERVPDLGRSSWRGVRGGSGRRLGISTWSRRRTTRRPWWRRSRGCRAWRAWRCAGRIAAGWRWRRGIGRPAGAAGKHWGSLLHHFTGSKYHNIRLRDLALARGARMSEYGYAVGDDLVTCATEEEVYAYLGMQFVPPPMREESGEIELALKGELPRIVEVADLRGDLHMHTTWSDGTASVREMAIAARDRGYAYICVTDHTHGLGIANGLTPERLRQQRAEIERVNAQLAPFRVLQGAEVEVRADGSLDFEDEVLAGLDLVIAAVHTSLRQGRERLTERALGAIRNPYVDVLAHPTGRLVGGRAGGDFDMEAIFAEAAATGTALEIDGDPARLDLRDSHARAAIAAGCMISIDSDAHAVAGLGNVEYGVGTAQRAWVPPDRVLNALTLKQLLARREKRVRA